MDAPVAEIIMIGSELLLGELQDTNATYLAQTLAEQGIPLLWKTTVGDNLERITEALRNALERSAIVLCSGGLGPTEDDLTREALAALMRVPLAYHPNVMATIESRFARFGRKITENNRKQAMFPEGTDVIPNPNGTAPGIWARIGEKVIICMPGVPFELKPMMRDYVLPRLRDEFGFSGLIKSWNLRVCGLGESRIDALIGDIIRDSENPKIGLLAGPEGVIIRISAKAETEDQADRMIASVEKQIQHRLGGIAFGRNGEQVEEALAELLRQKQRTLYVGESVTGGEICRRMTLAGPDVLLEGKIIPAGENVADTLLDMAVNMLVKSPFACAVIVAGKPNEKRSTGVVLADGKRHEFDLPHYGTGRLLQTRLAVAALEETRRRIAGLAISESRT
ncbi:MAG TPA: CinA family nicotinamide mononucleotide deamidase-related protein [Candidatus Hydrogenedentes bacterium]|nr:CinA family nicotinamide mononucleotide deamidase-related protein [Candidatus Hydrogenedentota bacterium]